MADYSAEANTDMQICDFAFFYLHT